MITTREKLEFAMKGKVTNKTDNQFYEELNRSAERASASGLRIGYPDYNELVNSGFSHPIPEDENDIDFHVSSVIETDEGMEIYAFEHYKSNDEMYCIRLKKGTKNHYVEHDCPKIGFQVDDKMVFIRENGTAYYTPVTAYTPKTEIVGILIPNPICFSQGKIILENGICASPELIAEGEFDYIPTTMRWVGSVGNDFDAFPIGADGIVYLIGEQLEDGSVNIEKTLIPNNASDMLYDEGRAVAIIEGIGFYSDDVIHKDFLKASINDVHRVGNLYIYKEMNPLMDITHNFTIGFGVYLDPADDVNEDGKDIMLEMLDNAGNMNRRYIKRGTMASGARPDRIYQLSIDMFMFNKCNTVYRLYADNPTKAIVMDGTDVTAIVNDILNA